MATESKSVRVDPENPDHHLWNNNGTWWVHFTVHRPDNTKYRVRQSTGTSDIEVARRRRDELIATPPPPSPEPTGRMTSEELTCALAESGCLETRTDFGFHKMNQHLGPLVGLAMCCEIASGPPAKTKATRARARRRRS